MELGEVIRHTEQELNVSETASHRKCICVSPQPIAERMDHATPSHLGTDALIDLRSGGKTSQELADVLAVFEKAGLQDSNSKE